MAAGKGSELFEDIMMLYGIEEPEDGFELQFHFKDHKIRLIQVETHPKTKQLDGDEWQQHIPDSEVDWDNPKEIAKYNTARADELREIRKEHDDGIDWDDGEEPPEGTKV